MPGAQLLRTLQMAEKEGTVLLAKVESEVGEAESRGLRGRVAALRRIVEMLRAAARVRELTAQNEPLVARIAAFAARTEQHAEVRAMALRVVRVLVDELVDKGSGASRFALLEVGSLRSALADALRGDPDEVSAALELLEVYVADGDGCEARRAQM